MSYVIAVSNEAEEFFLKVAYKRRGKCKILSSNRLKHDAKNYCFDSSYNFKINSFWLTVLNYSLINGSLLW